MRTIVLFSFLFLALFDCARAQTIDSTHYILNRNNVVQSASFNIDGYGAFNHNGSDNFSRTLAILNDASAEGANFQLTGDAVPGLATWVHTGIGFIERMRILSNGNVGIGLKAPDEIFHVRKDIAGSVYLKVQNNENDVAATAGIAMTTLNGIWRLKANRNTGFSISAPVVPDVLYVTNEGKVGIGTTAPGSYKLAVEGAIGARKVKVTQVQSWADFVFDDDYQLPALQDIETFIKANKHLPDIPDGDEVAKKGIDLAEMNMKLLQKVEEQMLYIINMNKRIEILTTELEMMQSKLESK
jgi:hypothetical protein